MRLYNYEICYEPWDIERGHSAEPDLAAGLPVFEQIEDFRLQQVLTRLSRRDRFILYSKILEDCSLDEIAVKLGMKYSAAAAVYYRMIHRIRKEVEGESDEF